MKEIIKTVEILPFKHIEPENTHDVFSEISILSYVGQGNEEFYGYDLIKDADIVILVYYWTSPGFCRKVCVSTVD